MKAALVREIDTMRARLYVPGVVLTALVACGGTEDEDVTRQAQNAAPSAEQSSELFLRALPEACEYLSASLAREVLQAEVTARPAGGDVCGYAGPAGSRKAVAFSMLMRSVDLLDSRTESREQLEEKMSALAKAKPVAVLDDVGTAAFVFDKGDSTLLISLTGIGGTAVLSDRIVSELSVSYSLSDPDQTYEARLDRLLTLANDGLSRLRELAGTTHGGSLAQ
jgi:hypothetical protein